MTIYEEMEKKDLKRNPVFTAIEVLKDPEDIRQFVKEYEDWMVKNGDKSIKGREVEVARSNVGYILGYYDKEVAKRWYAALPAVSHPIFGYGFGRGKEVTPEEAFNLGKKLAEKQKEPEHKNQKQGRFDNLEVV